MRNKMILCISKNLQLLEQLNNYLEDYHFLGFDSSEMAFQEITEQKHIPDVIFLDLDHNQTCQFCHSLHQDTSLSLIPVLLIIPEQMKHDPSQTLAMGASDFIHSPLKQEQVMTVLEKHLETRQKWWNIYHIYTPESPDQLDNALNSVLEKTEKRSSSKRGCPPSKENTPRDFNHFKKYLLKQVKPDQSRQRTLQNYDSTQIYELGEAFYLDSFKVCDYLSEFLSLKLIANLNHYKHLPGVVPIQFCRKNTLLPLEDHYGHLFIAIANPFQLEVLDILNQTFKKYSLLLAPPELIEAELNPSFCTSEQYREWKVRNAIRLNSVKEEPENAPQRVLPGNYPPHLYTAPQNSHFPTDHEMIYSSDLNQSPNNIPETFTSTKPPAADPLYPPAETDEDLSFAPYLETKSEEKLNRAYQAYRDQKEEDFIGIENDDPINQTLRYSDNPEDAPIIHMVHSLIEKAHALKASDIHIEPGEHEIIIRYRIDGDLRVMNRLRPQAIIRPIITRLKIMGQMDVGERRRPQDGRIHFADYNSQVNIELRVSIVPLKFGEKAVLRLLDSARNLQSLEIMGFSKQDLEIYRKKLNAPYGMILHVGPTGSGKTTTLYAALNEINTPDINIQTIENPVEYNMPGVNQLEVKYDIGLDFPQALRAYLRQDPDVILLGEIRDEETAHVACEAAMTGHRLLSTLHTNDAASTLIRLVEMGIKPYIISSSVLLICAQRLLRKLCPECKYPYEADHELKNLLKQDQEQELILYQAVGCAACNQNGYKGRVGVYELLVPNQSIRQAMNINGITPELMKVN